MNKHLPLLILALCGGLLAARAEHEPPALWRLTLDFQGYDGDYQAATPFPLVAGESVKTGGDIDGDLMGLTLTYECPTNRLIHGVDFSILYGDLSGKATYSGTFEGRTEVDTEVYRLSLRARHNLTHLARGNFHPYAFLGLAYRYSETEERGIIDYTPVDLELPVHRRSDAKTMLVQPGIGATLDLHRGRTTLGLRGEASLQAGRHEVDTTEGGPVDDGKIMGYNLLAAVYAVLPVNDCWSFYAQGGIVYQDWLKSYDELQPGVALFVSIGLQYEF